ncbi:MAG: GNAT family N-acetyltransferase [Planctomycetaceae bacterium]|jgi:GNAT superfamily N-acetyltransferase|nr:GNAT family N-acetyltransferase [Planctomycetaceae bacterium]
MTYPVSKIDWDSAFLGYPIGAIELAEYDEGKLQATLDACKPHFRLVVISLLSNGPDELNTSNVPCICYDRKLVFKKQVVSPVSPVDPRIRAYVSPLCSSQIEQLAILSGTYSRFKKDPELSAHYERLYLTWINHAVRGELADAVWTWYEGRKIFGLMTLRVAKRVNPATNETQREVRVGMLSVHAEKRHQGIGGALLDVCDFWSESLSIPTVSLSTQADNADICSLCKHKGYQQVNEETVYHYWSPGWSYNPRRGWMWTEC